MLLSDAWVNLFLSCNDWKDLVWFDNVQQQKPAMMGVYISPMAGPSWQLLHCAVHGPHGWNEVPVEGHRQAVWSQHRQRHEVPVQAQRWRLERSSCYLALQKPLDASDFWGQHSNNKSLSVRMVASRAKRTMEPNRLNISTFHNVFLFFLAERF